MDFLLKALANFIGNFLKGLIENVLAGVTDTFQALMKTYVTHSLVTDAHMAVVSVSIALIILFCVKQYFGTYVMETSGDPQADPLDILVRGAEATAITTCSSWFFFSFMNFCSAFAEQIVKGAGEEDFTVTFNSAVEGLIVNITTGGFVWLLFLLATLIGIFVFYVIAAIRAIELALMYIVLPLFAAELCYANHERFNGLVTSIIVTGLYFSLQLLMFSLFLNQFVDTLSGISASSTMNLGTFTTIGFLVAMLRSPRWLEKFAYNTGVGDTVKRGSMTVTSSVLTSTMLRRKI